MSETKIVFLSIVDGETTDYRKLQEVLHKVSIEGEYKFVVAPKQVESIDVEHLKNIIKEFETEKKKEEANDNPSNNE